MEQNSFKRFKILKIIQLAVAIVFLVAYFLLLLLTPSLRSCTEPQGISGQSHRYSKPLQLRLDF